ncbi:MAG: COX15/CtaA family protein [Pseudomonadales bacterium]
MPARETVNQRRLLRLVLFSIPFALVVIALGAYTRLADAGLGCPDWPGCYGFLSVPMKDHHVELAESRFPDAPVETTKAWWEMIHRYFAGTLGLLILSGAVLAVRARKEFFAAEAATASRPPVLLPIALLVLVCIQAAFGAWTVTLKLWPQVVTTHLLGGFATLSLLWLLALRLGIGARWWVPSSLRPHALLALVFVVLQIALGGWVSSNYAALACHDFPTCHDEWWPAMDLQAGFDFAQTIGPNYLGGELESDARVAIHYMHRVGALIVLLVVGSLAWRLFRQGSRLGAPLAGILALQILLGILNIVLVLPLLNATFHNVVGAILLLTLVAVNYRAFRAGLPA